MIIAHLSDLVGNPPKSEPGSGGVRRLVRDSRPLSVLIVEDEMLVSQVLSDAIEEYGGHVIGVAEIPADAFGLVVEHRPDVVVMDVRLKDGHDGLHCAEAMRLLYGTPIVFCTGYGDPQTVDRIRNFGGGSPLLFKPVRAPELCDAILTAYGS